MTARDEFPLHGFLRTIGGTIGEGVDAPGVSTCIAASGGPRGEGLAIIVETTGINCGGCVEVPAAGDILELKRRQAIAVCCLRDPARVPLVFVVVTFPQRHVGVGNRRAGHRIRKIDQRLFCGGLEDQRSVGNQNEVARRERTAPSFKQVSAQRQSAVYANLLVDRL